MRRAWGVALAAVLLGTAGCGDDDDAGPGLSPAGTPIAAGLEVPVGAQLVGPVFERVPATELPVTRRVAVLQLDGDPFAAWDELAEQALEAGLPMKASGVCEWRATSADPVTFAPYRDVSVLYPRPDHAVAMGCDAVGAGTLADGTSASVAMSLWWWAAGAELHVEVTEGGTDDASSSSLARDPGRAAPDTAFEQLPERDVQASGDPGSLFGRENNCMESGYGRMTVPEGARLVGGGTTPGHHVDFAAVLAVDDPEAVLRELQEQLDDPDQTNDDYRIAEESLADGTPVWRLSGGVTGGGGGCDMWSSHDGRAVMVTTVSD